jgi:hypothetical protein
VFGGYDASLRKYNDVDFKMEPDVKNRDLAVWVKSVNIIGNGTDSNARIPMMSTPFNALVDSAVTPFYLPPTICDSFAKYLDLKYNKTFGMYLINDTEHIRLEDQTPSMEIIISPEASGGKDVSILLPYPSLEQHFTHNYPNITSPWTRYFPIRPTTDQSQFTLGRVFLQEAYLIANYELRNFSLAQRDYSSDKPRIVTIRDPNHPATGDVSNGATYGLIAGGCALAGLLILLLVWRCQRRRSRLDEEKGRSSTTGKTELDSTSQTIYELDKGNEVFELSGKPSRVEAVNPELKCAFDDEVELRETVGPFELPANENLAESSVSAMGMTPVTGSSSHPSSPVDPDELISPIDGTMMSGMYTVSTYNHTISPITPTDTGLESIPESGRRRDEKR